MELHYFFYGTQVAEFERPKVSDLIAKNGIKLEMVGSIYSLSIKPSVNKVVILNVCD